MLRKPMIRLTLFVFLENPLPAVSKPAGLVAESSSFNLTPRVIDIVGSTCFLAGAGAGVEVEDVPPVDAPELAASVSRRISIWPRRSTWPGFSLLSEILSPLMNVPLVEFKSLITTSFPLSKTSQ